MTTDDRERRIARASLLAALSFTLMCPLIAAAQGRRPLPVAVFEVRGLTSTLPGDAETAGDLGLSTDVLPDREPLTHLPSPWH